MQNFTYMCMQWCDACSGHVTYAVKIAWPMLCSSTWNNTYSTVLCNSYLWHMSPQVSINAKNTLIHFSMAHWASCQLPKLQPRIDCRNIIWRLLTKCQSCLKVQSICCCSCVAASWMTHLWCLRLFPEYSTLRGSLKQWPATEWQHVSIWKARLARLLKI